MTNTELKEYIKTNKPMYISENDDVAIGIIGYFLETIIVSCLIYYATILISNSVIKQLIVISLCIGYITLIVYQLAYLFKNNILPFKKLKSIMCNVSHNGSKITYAKIYDQNTIIFVMNNQFYYLKVDTRDQSPEDVFKNFNHNNNTIHILKLSDLETIQVVKELSDNNFKTLDLKFKEIKKLEDQANLKLQQQNKLDQLEKEKNDLIKQLN